MEDALSLWGCSGTAALRAAALTQELSSWPCLGDLIQHSQLPFWPFPKGVFLTQIFSRDQQAWSVAMKKGLWLSSSKMALLKLEVMNVLQMNLFFKIHPHLFSCREELQLL